MADYIFYPAIALTGGTDEALDGYDGAELNDGDVGIVVNITGIRIYHLDDDSGAAESSPDVIAPDDNAGTKRWILQDIVDNHTHDARYYTETEITTWRNSVTQTEMGYVNGVTSDIQTQINVRIGAAGVTYENLSANGDIGTGAAQVAQGDHVHDGRYYTETELDAGQLDNRYFRENEHLDVSAGADDAGKPIKLDAGGKIDTTMIERSDLEDEFYTETELDAGQLDNRYFREDEALNASAGAGDAGKPIKLDAGGKIDTTMIERSDLEDTFYTETEDNTFRNGATQAEMGHLHGVTSDIQTQLGTKLENIVEDVTPQLGGDLDMNSKGIDFPSTPNITDVKDEDDMLSDSATMLATQQSIKKYVDDSKVATVGIVVDTTPQLGGDLDMNSKGIDFPTTPNITDCLDEDSLVSDSATKLATQQSIKAYIDAATGTSSGCHVYRTALQSIPNTTFTKIEFNIEGYDNQNEFDNAVNYRFTAKIAGVYAVTSRISLQNAPANARAIIAIYKNGAESFRGTDHLAGNAVSYPGNVATASVKLAVGDYIEIHLWQSSGGALNTTVTPSEIFLTVQKITAASEHGSAHANSSYAKVSDVKSAGTQGGIFTQDAWQTRTLNTKDNDPDGICSLASNQVTLDAGTYECRITVPAHRVNQNKARLRNTTGGTTLIEGTSEYCNNAAAYTTAHSIITGRFTIAASQVLEVQHYCVLTKADNGFGIASNVVVDEVYTTAEFWKLAEGGTGAGEGFSSRVSAYLGTNQAIPNDVWTKLEIDTEEFDGLGEFDPTTNYRFTPNTAGYYMVCGSVGFASLGDGDRASIAIYKTGTAGAYHIINTGAAQSPVVTVSKLFYLSVTDYIELYGRHDFGAAANAQGVLTHTYLSVHRIS